MTTEARADATTVEQLFGARTALVVDDAISAERAAATRARIEAAGYQPYRLLDRGRYDYVGDPLVPYLLADLTALAAARTGRALAPVESRVLRLGPGDYLLSRHDRVDEDHPLELTLDLSPSPVPDAFVDYRRRGQLFFRVPCAPRSLALVERGPTVTANHTYVSQRHAGATVIRLVAVLRELPPPRRR